MSAAIAKARTARLIEAMAEASLDALLVYGNAWQIDYLRYATDFGILEGQALALVHRSCPATAQIFGATGGYYCRYAISHTEGATFGPHPTVEDVAANWDLIRDRSLPNELDGEAMAWGVNAYSSRLKALAAELQAY